MRGRDLDEILILSLSKDEDFLRLPQSSMAA